ncbi:MAG: hypothetical protein IKP88_12215 [Lachnospiraceae bacterium]|nr:hypothetical protein [Lachnospiraceae bacterium]
MSTENDRKPIEYDYEKMDMDALQKRIMAYKKLSENMQKAAEAIRQKGAKA